MALSESARRFLYRANDLIFQRGPGLYFKYLEALTLMTAVKWASEVTKNQYLMILYVIGISALVVRAQRLFVDFDDLARWKVGWIVASLVGFATFWLSDQVADLLTQTQRASK